MYRSMFLLRNKLYIFFGNILTNFTILLRLSEFDVISESNMEVTKGTS